jgi:DNA polymerase I
VPSPHRQQLSLFAPRDLITETPAPGSPTLTRHVDSGESFRELLSVLDAALLIAFDTETSALDVLDASLVGLSFAVTPGHAWYVACDSDDGGWSLAHGSADWHALMSILSRPTAQLVAHNAKYDLSMLRRVGVTPVGRVADTMIAQFLIDPLGRGLGLKSLARQLLGWEMTEIEQLIGRGAGQISMRDVPAHIVAPYAGADADATLHLHLRQSPQLTQLNLDRLNNEVEIPLIPVLVDMELTGVALDAPYLHSLSNEMGARMHTLETQIFGMVGRSFNIGSPQQLSTVLYKQLGLPVAFNGRRDDDDGAPSTSAWALDDLKSKHPIIPLILEHRELSKLKGTYADALPARIHPSTGRLHCNFNQAVVITGRLSSSNPNLQNVPITSEMGRRVRAAFIGQPGGQVISADYSQVELRILAHLADDPALKAAFARDEDIHASTAAAIYGVTLDQVTAHQRGHAKKINFGLAYGMGAYGLSRSTGMTEPEAGRYIAAYFQRFTGVKRWLDMTKRKMASERFVDTLYGRRRPFKDMRDQPERVRRRAERLAINHPVQGSAADIVKLAMVQLHKRLATDGYASKLTLQVHDELVIDCPAAEVAEVSQIVREVMASAVPLSVPLRADVAVGQNWDVVA